MQNEERSSGLLIESRIVTATLETRGSPPDPAAGPLVWLPFDPAPLEPLPPGLRLVVGDPWVSVPDEIAEVEFLVVEAPGRAPLRELIPRMPKLRVVQTTSAGVEGLVQELPDGITLCNGKGIHDTATAELAVSLTLAAQRDLPTYQQRQIAGTWASTLAPGLAGKRVMILGHGSVGEAIEARLSGFEADIVRVARTARDGVAGVAELGDLLPTADVVIVVVPLTSQTRGMVDGAFLAKMKPGALLVNVARGPVAVTDDLIAACAAGRIRVALDVTDPEPLPAGHPLWRTPNVLITPHVGGLSEAMTPRIHRFLREQLGRLAAGLPLVNVVRGEY
jgi:phosphoglycerate dehydrogenase-like enzyme